MSSEIAPSVSVWGTGLPRSNKTDLPPHVWHLVAVVSCSPENRGTSLIKNNHHPRDHQRTLGIVLL